MSALAIIPDGAVLIRNGRVEEVGPTRRIERLKTSRDAVELDARGSVVMPAFVDSATRPVFPHGAGRDTRETRSLVQAFTEAKRTALEDEAEAVMAGMVRHGTLATEVLTGYGGDSAGELRLMRIYAALRGRPLDVFTSLTHSDYIADSFEGTRAEWTNLVIIPLFETAFRLQLLHSATALLGGQSSDLEHARSFLQAARNRRIPTIIHASPGNLEAAVQLGAETKVTVLHGLDDIPLSMSGALASSSAILSFAPALADGQGRSFPPIRELIDQGAAVALGTSFSRAGNDGYNMLQTMALACHYTRMSPAEAVVASTINSAYAVGCAHQHGSLEPGKLANIVIFDCPEYSDLLRNPSIHHVSRVLRRGRVIYRRGRVAENER